MKKHYLYIICVCFIVLGIFSCSDTVPVSKETSEKPILYPDYADVTIPNNIAPLNFKIQNAHTEAFAVFCFEEVKLQVERKKRGNSIFLPPTGKSYLGKRQAKRYK